VAYDARRFGWALLAVGDSTRSTINLAWNAEQVETPGRRGVTEPVVTVVVLTCNDAERISGVLEHLAAQDLPADRRHLERWLVVR
jgi:hypothetical protein